MGNRKSRTLERPDPEEVDPWGILTEDDIDLRSVYNLFDLTESCSGDDWSLHSIPTEWWENIQTLTIPRPTLIDPENPALNPGRDRTPAEDSDTDQDSSPDPDPDQEHVTPLPGQLEVTYEADSLDICEDESVAKAVMPCGHIMGVEAMRGYVESKLGQCAVTTSASQFQCPLCEVYWPYHLVQHVAHLTQDQQRQLEEKLTINFLMTTQGYRQCGQCRSWCYREDSTSTRLPCPCCSRQPGQGDYHFCWACGRQWLNSTDDKKCGNKDCNGVDPRVHVLKTCPKKVIEFTYKRSRKCPKIRACPKCGILIEHTDACKHMECKCGYEFCFVCLKGQDKRGKWRCGDYDSPCWPARRQRAKDIVGTHVT